MNRKRFLYVLGFLFLLVFAPLAYQIDRTAQALPKLDGRAQLAGLGNRVTVDFDGLGIPTVNADNREDAMRSLGLLHAGDRLFQMDLMRRNTRGRLSEIFGAKALPHDREQRFFGFQQIAEQVYAQLPDEQKRVLTAYAAGVNARLQSGQALPPEFRLLGYTPEPWEPTDSLLVALGMFQTLNTTEAEDRSLSVMTQVLPPKVTAFLTPDTDAYATPLTGGSQSRRPEQPIPAEDIARLIDAVGPLSAAARGAVREEAVSVGSNNWAVNASKSADNRAILADDMHLPLNVPNIWYRARLRYASADLNGVTLPGLPLLIAGSNGHVAWGYTNVDADVLDLVKLETDPTDPIRYRVGDQWQALGTRAETIAVKDAPADIITVSTSQWGPVSPDPLLGSPVAVHWIVNEPGAVNLGLLEMDGATTLEEAMAVLNRAGSPVQNAVLADERGRIGWTYMGNFPRRIGMDGSIATSWADGQRGWRGFIPPDELPRVIDPPSGVIATANNRTLGKDYPYAIGYNFSHGYRAHRATRWLREKDKLSEADLFALQLDSVAGVYDFYRDLALEFAGETAAHADPDLADIRAALLAWDGRMDAGSKGIALLSAWRNDLAAEVFAPLVAPCVAADPRFSYEWREQETPLRAILGARLPATLPDRRAGDWPSFLTRSLRTSAAKLRAEQGIGHLADLAWEAVNPIRVGHPFGKLAAPLAAVLDMPSKGLSGCNRFCLRVVHHDHGAGERMVVSPNHPEDGILHMPGGQSGHPLSPHYRDQHAAWATGTPLPFLPGKPAHRLELLPASPVRDGQGEKASRTSGGAQSRFQAESPGFESDGS